MSSIALGQMDYEDALNILDDWEYRELPDGERVILAIDQAKQALRDCLEQKCHHTVLTLTRDDIVRCARDMGMPAEAITDDLVNQVKQYLSLGRTCYWDEFVKRAINFALKS